MLTKLSPVKHMYVCMHACIPLLSRNVSRATSVHSTCRALFSGIPSFAYKRCALSTTHTHTHTHTQTHTHTHTDTHRLNNRPPHFKVNPLHLIQVTPLHARTHIPTHTYTQTHIHTHALTHTHSVHGRGCGPGPQTPRPTRTPSPLSKREMRCGTRCVCVCVCVRVCMVGGGDVDAGV